MHTTVQSFRLAPMSPLIWMLTLALLAIPAVFFSTAMVGRHLLTVPALCVVVMYVWVWLRFRPTRFVVYPDRLEVRWPLKRRSIPHKDIAEVRLIDKRALHSEIGWGMRVGAGGLWGALAGCGPSAGRSSRCTSRAPMALCGSSAWVIGRGLSHRH